MGANLEQMLKELSSKFDRQTIEIQAMRNDNSALADKLRQIDAAIPDLASDIAEIARRNELAENTPRPDSNLQEFSGYAEGSIRKEAPVRLEFKGKKNSCPYCTEHGKGSLLDLTKSGRWACRMCGKHWYAEALGQKYTRELEKFIRTGDDDKDPVNVFRKEKLDDDRDSEVATLKKELSELKDLILRGALANGKSS